MVQEDLAALFSLPRGFRKFYFHNNNPLNYNLLDRKILFLFTGMLFSISTYSQRITGIVMDQQTHDTISFASVYFSGTFTGTHTDHKGRFSLDLAGKPAVPITVSAIGYYSVTISAYNSVTPLVVFLEPKVYEMKEVVVSAESLEKERTANMKIFRREFLGTSIYALNSEIVNEKEITFNYGSDKDTLRAYANKPIQMSNKSLGFNIMYYLDKFEFDRNSTDFLVRGNILFMEDTLAIKNKNRIEKRRRHAYLGSIMHYFRSLWADQLKANGFTVNTLLDKPLTCSDLVIADSVGKYFYTPETIFISYSGKRSFVEFLSDSVIFYKDGLYDYSGISWTGQMASLRIGDWLPYEYEAAPSKDSDIEKKKSGIKKQARRSKKSRSKDHTSPPSPLS